MGTAKRCTSIAFIVMVVILWWYLRKQSHTTKSVQLAVQPTISQATLAPCGQICNYTATIEREPGRPYPIARKDIVCGDIMKRMAYRGQHVVNPPARHPPPELVREFTMNGQMPIKRLRYFQPESQNKSILFNQFYVRDLMRKVIQGAAVNTYRVGKCVEDTVKKYEEDIRGKRGLVIGTLRPWLEAILLAYGASHVTTLEYGKLKINHTQIQVYTPYDFADKYLNGEVNQFDFGASFSSLEHSGLGRFTDPLNPYGDLEAMAQTWCMTKPGALFILGVPCSDDHSDYIVWNAHRVYGSKRLRQLTANWRVLQTVECADFHKVIVLRKL